MDSRDNLIDKTADTSQIASNNKNAEDKESAALEFHEATLSARRRMIEGYHKFLNIKDWSSLPDDVKKYLKE